MIPLPRGLRFAIHGRPFACQRHCVHCLRVGLALVQGGHAAACEPAVATFGPKDAAFKKKASSEEAADVSEELKDLMAYMTFAHRLGRGNLVWASWRPVDWPGRQKVKRAQSIKAGSTMIMVTSEGARWMLKHFKEQGCMYVVCDTRLHRVARSSAFNTQAHNPTITTCVNIPKWFSTHNVTWTGETHDVPIAMTHSEMYIQTQRHIHLIHCTAIHTSRCMAFLSFSPTSRFRYQ